MKKIILSIVAVAALLTASAQYKAPQIVANGGYHRSPASGVKNTMSALKAAQKLKVYGSECDVNLTKDGEVLVVQSGWHPNKKANPKANVQGATKAKLLDIPYTNGEKVCTLEEFLKRAAKKPATKLILDIKSQNNIKRESMLVEKTLEIVAKAGMEANVEYIAAHAWTCFELAQKAPQDTKISYLDGNYDPAYVKAMGCSGIDYNFAKLKKKKGWIKQAQKLGLTVNVWTVNKDQDIRWCIQNGVDIITTDDPILVKTIIKDMCGKK